MYNGDVPAVVIDSGSGTSKAGFAGDDVPRITLPSIVGRPKRQGAWYHHENENFVGLDAQERRGVLSIKHPIERGLIENWEDMEQIWHHIFYNELRVAPEEQPVLMTEVPLNPKINRERMTEIMFEKFDTPSMYLNNSAVLSVYTLGRTTGCAVDCGYGVTHVVPVYEGYVLPQGVIRLDIAGRDLTDYFMKLMVQKGVELTTVADREILNNMKELYTYIPVDFEEELSKSSTSKESCNELEKSYQLPDGSTITIGSERFKCPEILFKPSLICSEAPGIPECIYQSIMKCDICIRREFCVNIVLSGGTTMIPGFAERIKNDLTPMSSYTEKSRIYAPPERSYLSWIGGSIISSLSSFQLMWITKAEYDEAGPAFVHRKCF